MKTRRWAALFLAAMTVAPPAGASPVPGRCSAPEPVLKYSAKRMSISLTADYSNCRWWHRRTAVVTAEVERTAVASPMVEGMATASVCMGEPVRLANGRTRVQRVESCSAGVALPHDDVEVATYSGKFEFPWRDGAEEVTFSYTCSTTPLGASCN